MVFFHPSSSLERLGSSAKRFRDAERRCTTSKYTVLGFSSPDRMRHAERPTRERPTAKYLCLTVEFTRSLSGEPKMNS